MSVSSQGMPHIANYASRLDRAALVDKPARSAALSLKMSRMPRLAMFYGIVI